MRSVSSRFAVALVAVFAVGCSNGADQTEPVGASATASGRDDSSVLFAEPDAQPSVSLRCEGTGSTPPADFEVVLDAVALPASPRYAQALQTAERTAADGSTFYFAKTGLFFRTDASFDLIVPPELEASMVIGWGGPAQPAHRVSVDCSDSSSGAVWIGVPGGYWVTEPMCASVVVRSGGAAQRVALGLGRACEGQAPPPEPTDG